MNVIYKTFFLFCLTIALSHITTAKTIDVGSGKLFTAIKPALTSAQEGDTVNIYKGIYKEGNIIIDKALTIMGKDFPVIDGELAHEIISIKCSNVTISGLKLINSGRSAMTDPAAVKAYNVNNIRIENNELENNFFGIYLQYVSNCQVKNNNLFASQEKEYLSGNGVHCWKSDSLQIIGNKIFGHRDGIYFEFVTGSVIWRNIAHNNLRYGLHFMFAHNNAYFTNYFKNNGAGVAVMFTKKVVFMNNTFEENWGDAAYGVLFKELSDCYLSGNIFYKNTTGIFFDGSNRIVAERNLFKGNGWALRMQANCMDNKIEHNNFLGNIFDVTTNGTLMLSQFAENYWDKYQGYDLNKDIIGDVPYHPLSLYAVIVEKNPPAMLLYQSFMISLLDKSEKVLPSLTPENFVDKTPRMLPYTL